MVKMLRGIFDKNRIWIIVILILNLIFGGLLWLVNDKAFLYIFPTMIIGSLILYFSTAVIIYKKDIKRKDRAQHLRSVRQSERFLAIVFFSP